MVVKELLALNQGRMGEPFWSVHLRQTRRDVPCGLDGVAHASPDKLLLLFSRCGPILFDLV